MLILVNVVDVDSEEGIREERGLRWIWEVAVDDEDRDERQDDAIA